VNAFTMNDEIRKNSIYNFKMVFKSGFDKEIGDAKECFGNCLTKLMIQKHVKYDMRFRIDVELEIIGAFSKKNFPNDSIQK
jgi:hypothetical protein